MLLCPLCLIAIFKCGYIVSLLKIFICDYIVLFNVSRLFHDNYCAIVIISFNYIITIILSCFWLYIITIVSQDVCLMIYFGTH